MHNSYKTPKLDPEVLVINSNPDDSFNAGYCLQIGPEEQKEDRTAREDLE